MRTTTTGRLACLSRIDHVVHEWFGPPYLALVGASLDGIGKPVGNGFLAEYSDDLQRLRLLPAGLLTTTPEGGVAATLPHGARDE